MLLCLADAANEKIQNYPTNFFAIKQADIDLLINKGQSMTEEYLDKYYPELKKN